MSVVVTSGVVSINGVVGASVLVVSVVVTSVVGSKECFQLKNQTMKDSRPTELIKKSQMCFQTNFYANAY